MDSYSFSVSPAVKQDPQENNDLNRLRTQYRTSEATDSGGRILTPGPAAVLEISQKARELAQAENQSIAEPKEPNFTLKPGRAITGTFTGDGKEGHFFGEDSVRLGSLDADGGITFGPYRGRMIDHHRASLTREGSTDSVEVRLQMASGHFTLFGVRPIATQEDAASGA